MPKSIFRKVSLERLSSPEQLDKLLVIVKLKGWLVLLALIVITVAILFWAFLGQIPITATGKGILLDPRGLQGIFSRANGRVTQIFARTGAEVEKGEVLVILENHLITAQQQVLQKEINILNEKLKIEQQLLQEQITEKKKEQKRKENLELQILENQKAKLKLLEKQLKNEPKEKQPDLEKEILEQHDMIEAQLLAIEVFQTKMKIETTSRQVNELESMILSKTGESNLLQSRIENLIVRAPQSGRVIEIDVMLGREIKEGEPIVWIQSALDHDEPLPFYTFVPLVKGEKIKPHMRAEINLLAIDSQKYGQIKGRVVRVLPYAASLNAQQIAGIPSQLLKQFLSAGPTSLLVVIQPLSDPLTPTGYAWTTERGPPKTELLPGAIGDARIIIQSKRPITYVMPILTE